MTAPTVIRNGVAVRRCEDCGSPAMRGAAKCWNHTEDAAAARDRVQAKMRRKVAFAATISRRRQRRALEARLG